MDNCKCANKADNLASAMLNKVMLFGSMVGTNSFCKEARLSTKLRRCSCSTSERSSAPMVAPVIPFRYTVSTLKSCSCKLDCSNDDDDDDDDDDDGYSDNDVPF